MNFIAYILYMIFVFLVFRVINWGYEKVKKLFKKKGCEERMSLTEIYTTLMDPIKDVLIVSGMLSLTIALIVMLVNMIVGAATGKGFSIGLR